MNSEEPVRQANAVMQPMTELNSGRHLVVLHVPWSIYAAQAVDNARSSGSALAAYGATLTVLDEDDPTVRQWLVTLGVCHSAGHAIGAGSLIWITDGRAERFMLNGSSIDSDIEKASREVWNNAE